MTLPSSGQISLSDLRTEYTNLGSQGQVAMNDFYYGSTHVQKNTCTDQARGDASHPTKASHFDNIPAVGAGQIKLSNFYSKVYYYARQTTVQVNGSNASINVNAIEDEALKKNSNNTVFFVASTNGNCKATSTGNYALTIPQGGRPNTTCYLINDHAIYGKGGRGGDGGNSGETGGTALSVASNIYLKNNNRILGGGGGGGGGGAKINSYNECYCCNTTNASIAGSGGGGGKGGGAGGNAGSALNANFTYGGGNGAAGDEDTSSVPGSGGSGGGNCVFNTVLGTYCSNGGGAGGGWGSSGGGSGGSGGNAIRRRSGAYYVVVTSGTTAGSTVTF